MLDGVSDSRVPVTLAVLLGRDWQRLKGGLSKVECVFCPAMFSWLGSTVVYT